MWFRFQVLLFGGAIGIYLMKMSREKKELSAESEEDDDDTLDGNDDLVSE